MSLFFAKRNDPAGLVSVAFTPEGIGFAHVSRGAGLPPVLDDCDFEPGGADAVTLGRLAGRHKRLRTPCSMLVGEDDYSLLQVDAPAVPAGELRAAVRWKVRDLIDFPVEEAVIDVFDLPPPKMAGRARSLYVVAAQSGLLAARVEALHAAGLRLEVIDIPELAQRNLAAELPEDATGVALLALGADSGLVTLTRARTLYLARRLELGLDALDGERPAASADAEPQGRTRDWLDALLVQLQRSLDFYESNFAQPPIGDLVLAPMARPVAGMKTYLAAQLGLRVRELDLNDLIDTRAPLAVDLQARCLSAVGGALRDAERPP